MFYRLAFIVLIVFVYSGLSCTDRNSFPATFYGVHHCYTTGSGAEEQLLFSDTVKLELQRNEYRITGKNRNSYGYGSWTVTGDTIVFSDKLLRSGIHSADWVIDGRYAFKAWGETLHLVKNNGNSKNEILLTGS